MSVDINSILDTLIKKRRIVMIVLIAFVVVAAGVGYVYQNKENRQKEAASLYDRTWESVYTVIAEAQNPDTTPERMQSAASLYMENVSNLDTLVFDYPETVSGARAALLVVRIAEEPALVSFLGTNKIEAAAENALETVKKNHPDFWGSAVAIAEAIRYEKTGRFAEANTSYEEALASDKKKFLSDFILVSLARNKEILQDREGALKDYQSVVDDYPDSSWNNFVLGKIYLLSQTTNPSSIEVGTP
ncbi:MAG: tetratricopeptide repeat protein [Brevinema sp.]